MPTSLVPVEQKKALLIGVRSVVGPKYGDLARLDFTHRDVIDLRDRLIQSHGYQPENITLMIDSSRHPMELWPTRCNILHQLDLLTHNVPEGCYIFFYFSGHGIEEECCGHCTNNIRADGLDDEIISADGKPILDHMLHDKLITPLEKVKGSKLFALFDCCHSETLLDLQRGKGPNKYSKKWNIGRDRLFKALTISIMGLLELFRKHCQIDLHRATRRKSIVIGNESTIEAHDVGELSVICLSACRDGQLAHDDCQRKLTFTRCFMDVMAENPQVSWWELRAKLKSMITDIRARYESVTWEQDPRISTNSSRADLTCSVESHL